MKEGKEVRETGPEEPDLVRPVRNTARPHPMEARIHWLQPKKTAFRVGLLMTLVLVAAPLLIHAGLPTSDDPGRDCIRFSFNFVMWSFSGLMLMLVVPLLVFVHRILNTRLGFRDEWVLVERANGAVHIARDEDLISVNQGFIIEGVTIPTGNTKMPLYKASDLEEWLQPRLARGSRLGPIQQLDWQWRNRRGLVLLMCGGILVGLVLVASIESGWMEDQFKAWLESQPECRDVMQDMRDAGKR
jgi:hypothetical protein